MGSDDKLEIKKAACLGDKMTNRIQYLSFRTVFSNRSFPGSAVVKNPPANAGDSRDWGSILGLGRSLAVGNGNPLQYFLPGKPQGQISLVGLFVSMGSQSWTCLAMQDPCPIHLSQGWNCAASVPFNMVATRHRWILRT